MWGLLGASLRCTEKLESELCRVAALAKAGVGKPFQALWLRDLHIVHISTRRQGRVIHSSPTRAARG